MVSGTVASFEDSLDELDVGWTHTDPDGLGETLAELGRDPIVGVPFPFDDASLPGWVNSEPTPADLDAATTGVTAASVGIADYGSVVIRSTAEPTEQVSLYCDRHVAVLRAADVVPGMAEAFEWFGPQLREDRASAIIATGPSATADMGALVRGAHGPREVHVVILDGRDGPSDERDSAGGGEPAIDDASGSDFGAGEGSDDE
jgi:L-lactate dehydrogenase complex protein LldG